MTVEKMLLYRVGSGVVLVYRPCLLGSSRPDPMAQPRQLPYDTEKYPQLRQLEGKERGTVFSSTRGQTWNYLDDILPGQETAQLQ